MKNEITVTVPTGIGDIFWVHQKLSPYFQTINYTVIGSNEDAIRTRSLPFLPLWSGVGNVNGRAVHQSEYDLLIQQTPPLPSIIESGATEIAYAVNAAVNAGTRLENIDPGMMVALNIPVAWKEIERPEKYLLLYVSGSCLDYNRVWRVEQWATAVRLLQERLGHLPIVMIGASYDREVQGWLKGLLADQEIVWHIDLPAPQVCCLLKHASFYFGYQSGLGILADNYNTQQIMMYFHFPPLWYAWAKKENIANKTYQGFGFNDAPEVVIAQSGGTI